MDFLSHLFLPLTAVYVTRPTVFESPWLLALAGFGLLSDFDKFLRMPGLLHSLVTIGPICLAVVGTEYRLRGDLRSSPVIVVLIISHLVLDFVDGGPVPLLFPLVETGIGLRYPVQTVFGEGVFGLRFVGPLATVQTTAPQAGNNTYGFITGAGVASLLLFGLVYLTDRWDSMGGQSRQQIASSSATGHREKQTETDSAADGDQP